MLLKRMIMTAAVFIFVLLCVSSNIATAKAKPELIATLIVDKNISDEELEELDLNYDEFALIAIEVAVLNGVNKNEIVDFFQKNKKMFRKNYYNFKNEEIFQSQVFKNDETYIGILQGSCSQTIEKENGTNGQTYASRYVIDRMCDNDPSDDDYRYDFSVNWTDDPNDVRWWATWYVRNVFTTVYGGNLLGCSLCTCPLQVCLGTRGVALAGGAGNVQEELYIWHK